jgi:hypothetical protein
LKGVPDVPDVPNLPINVPNVQNVPDKLGSYEQKAMDKDLKGSDAFDRIDLYCFVRSCGTYKTLAFTTTGKSTAAGR